MGRAMVTFVTLRIENDDEARTLVEDIEAYPDHALLTPIQEHEVFVTVEIEGSLAALVVEGWVELDETRERLAETVGLLRQATIGGQ